MPMSFTPTFREQAHLLAAELMHTKSLKRGAEVRRMQLVYVALADADDRLLESVPGSPQ
jgi:hypothetical protein